MFQLTCDVLVLWIYYASYIDHNCGNAVSLHNAYRAHLFTCSEQFNSFIMETTFYMFGIEYLRWTNNKGVEFSAVKEQVEFLGKEVFEQELEDYIEEIHAPMPDGISFQPMWKPTDEELAKSIEDKYRWMRDMEIM